MYSEFIIDILAVVTGLIFVIRAWVRHDIEYLRKGKKNDTSFLDFVLSDLFKQSTYLGFEKKGNIDGSKVLLFNLLTVLFYVAFFSFIIWYFLFYKG
jgi:hypothetical protein